MIRQPTRSKRTNTLFPCTPLFGSGAVGFAVPEANDTAALDAGRWWKLRRDANWQRPDGTRGGAPNEPVVDVTYADALAYAHWLGRELPSEPQWEFAPNSGRDNPAAQIGRESCRGRGCQTV